MVRRSRALPFIWKVPLVMGRRANSFSAHRSHWATSSLLQQTGCRPGDGKKTKNELSDEEAEGPGGRRRKRRKGRKERGREEGGSKKDIEEVKIKAKRRGVITGTTAEIKKKDGGDGVRRLE